MTEMIAPPNSKESEMMVLGSMLTSINSLNIAADALSSFDFYYSEHQTIFDILQTAYKILRQNSRSTVNKGFMAQYWKKGKL